MRAPSLLRHPDPFSPHPGLVQHGSFLSDTDPIVRDTEFLEWLDEYGSMSRLCDDLHPVGTMRADGPCPETPPHS